MYDGGQLPDGREGSTIVDLSVPGRFRVVRRGGHLESTLATLAAFGLVREEE